jgi:hypothetical protein
MAKDIFHDLVREALEKDGWTITHDPYVIKRQRRYEIDLGAEKVIAAEREEERIAVEIKSFVGSSFTYDFHLAFGQYSIYQYYLNKQEPERKLYLAVSNLVFTKEFSTEDIEEICRVFKVQLLIFDIEKESLVQWIKK